MAVGAGRTQKNAFVVLRNTMLAAFMITMCMNMMVIQPVVGGGISDAISGILGNLGKDPAPGTILFLFQCFFLNIINVFDLELPLCNMNICFKFVCTCVRVCVCVVCTRILENKFLCP